MGIPLQKEDLKRIKEGIRQKYAKVSISPEGLFKYPTGRAALEALKYDSQKIAALPEEAIASYCGVGNPFSLGPIHPGEKVLDVGCGGGLDSLVASLMVGPSGKVIGIDLSAEMVARARDSLRQSNLSNVEFLNNADEILPFPDESFDVVISNGVFNLIPNKLKALQEVRRVLKANGRLMMSDQILTGELPKDRQERIDSWSRWEGGAIPGKDFLALVKKAGFEEVELVEETGFNSSPVTKGVLLRAIKKVRGRDMSIEEGLSKYQEFFNVTYGDGVINRKMKHLIALGASLAAGCEPWTSYCLAVARELGATEEELKETMAIAMTVGATKIQVLQEKVLSTLLEKEPLKIQTQSGTEQGSSQSSCFTWASQSNSG